VQWNGTGCVTELHHMHKRPLTKTTTASCHMEENTEATEGRSWEWGEFFFSYSFSSCFTCI